MATGRAVLRLKPAESDNNPKKQAASEDEKKPPAPRPFAVNRQLGDIIHLR
jgi:hypothetical protein